MLLLSAGLASAQQPFTVVANDVNKKMVKLFGAGGFKRHHERTALRFHGHARYVGAGEHSGHFHNVVRQVCLFHWTAAIDLVKRIEFPQPRVIRALGHVIAFPCLHVGDRVLEQSSKHKSALLPTERVRLPRQQQR